MQVVGERDDLLDARYQYWNDDGNLGNWWTKIRDKVIKPVGRVVAAYYTGGASEVAFKAYDAQKAQKEAKKYQEQQLKAIAQAGNMYPPQGYPPSMDPAAQRAYAQGMPPPAYPPQGYPQQPYNTGVVPPGVYATGAQAYNVSQGAPNMTIQPVPQSAQISSLPSWAIPAGIGAVVLLVLASQRR